MMRRLITFVCVIAAAAFAVSAALATPTPQPPAGWPATTGSLDGAATGGCGSSLVLTSGDVEYPAFGSYSSYNFDLPMTYTFATLPVGAIVNDEFTVLSGTQSEGEPYLIVRFTDGTQVFVYSVEINGTGTGTYYSTLAGNQYITYSQALASYGSKTVKSVTLAVDNGDLTASFSGLSSDACPFTAPPPNMMFMCYSHYEPDGGQVFTVSEGLAILGDPSVAGWTQGWAPFAIQGTPPSTSNPVVGSYYLTCQLPSGYALTGQYHGGDGPGASDSIAGMDSLTAGSAQYPIAVKQSS